MGRVYVVQVLQDRVWWQSFFEDKNVHSDVMVCAKFLHQGTNRFSSGAVIHDYNVTWNNFVIYLIKNKS